LNWLSFIRKSSVSVENINFVFSRRGYGEIIDPIVVDVTDVSYALAKARSIRSLKFDEFATI
jgi:hypothetical protein